MNWSRTEVKSKAKEFLKDNYWNTFFATLIFTIISGGINFKYNIDKQQFSSLSYYKVVFFSSVAILVNIFIVNVLEVGLANFFIEGEKGNIKVSNIFSMFKCENYTNIVKIMFLRNLYVFLWSLLFIIPGIIKSYEYNFIPYLLAENQNISSDEVFEQTKCMTDNQKMDIFILNLSFFGWYFLGALIIIGAIFVVPYHQATNAQLYFKLKNSY